jgi:hypothetical protein
VKLHRYLAVAVVNLLRGMYVAPSILEIYSRSRVVVSLLRLTSPGLFPLTTIEIQEEFNCAILLMLIFDVLRKTALLAEW